MRNSLDGKSWVWLLSGFLLLAPLSALAEDLFPDKNLEAAVRKYVFSKKQTTEPLSALDFPLGPAYFSPGIDDSVPESLVVAFVVKVLAKLSEGSTQ